MKLLVDLYTKNVSKIIKLYLFIVDDHDKNKQQRFLLLVGLNYGIRLLGLKKQKNTYNRSF
jgi:hypothetical protein